MKLSNRINHIIRMCNFIDTIIDVGCDHGYISINLIRENKCKKCYAVDINRLPLLNAEKNIKNNNLEFYIQCIQSNGFDFLDEVSENIGSVIAGMGGSTIANILQKNMSKIYKMDYILIQPNSYAKDIRKFLVNKKIHIEKEDVIFSEGVYYEYILIFPKLQGVLSKEYQNFLLEFGYDISTCVMDNIDGKYNEFILYKIRKYEKVLLEMKNSKLKNYDKYVSFKNKILMLRRCIR